MPKVVITVALAALLFCACSSSRRRSSTTTPATAQLGAASCRPPSPLSTSTGLPEVEGTPVDQVSLWGLLFGPAPIKAGDQVKVVWRMTGSGPLTVVPFGPDGRARPLAWGPGYHTSSSYHRPGEEWGTGLNFDDAGCWRIQLTRTTGQANVYFVVTPKSR